MKTADFAHKGGRRARTFVSSYATDVTREVGLRGGRRGTTGARVQARALRLGFPRFQNVGAKAREFAAFGEATISRASVPGLTHVTFGQPEQQRLQEVKASLYCKY